MKRSNRMEEKFAQMMDAQVVPGVSYAWMRGGESKLFYQGVQGTVKPYDGITVLPGMRYDLASLSKVVGTTSRILQLIGAGKLKLETPVRTVLEDFRHEDITIGDLMLHQSGLMAEVIHKKQLTKENILEYLYETPLVYKRGTGMVYSDVGFILLGMVIQRLDGMALEESFQRFIFHPLGMEQTTFLTSEDKWAYIPTEVTRVRGCIHGEVHDSKAYLLGQSGSAGLFSTLEDLVIFVNAYLNQNERLFGKELFDLLEQTEAFGRTYGWSKEYGDDFLYHTGFTGTSILMNRKRKEGFILLTNRIHPSRNNPEFLEWRKVLNDAFCTQNYKDI